MAKVFVSYSRKDIDFAKRITTELAKSQLDFWIDWEGIPPTVDWWREIEKGVEEADIFLFLISPDSAASKVCGREIDTAVKNAKRIIPLVVRDTRADAAPKQLSHLNWIFFRESDNFDASFGKLMTAIQTDYEWVSTHRRLQVKALEWERNNKENSFLLRGKDLQDAELQLATNTSREPHPTDLQRDLIFESRKATDRQRRVTTGISIAGIIVLATLAVWGWGQAVLATNNATTAQAESTRAFNNAGTAQAESIRASNNAATAVANEQIALARQLASDANATLANPRGSPEMAALLSLQALRIQQETYVPSADEALNNGLNRLYTTKIIDRYNAKVTAVALSPAGDQLLVGYLDGAAGLYDVNTGSELFFFDDYSGYQDSDDNPTLFGVHSVAFSRSGKFFLIAESDGVIQIWDTENNVGKVIHTNAYLLWSAEFSPDENYILIGQGWPFEGPGRIEIWSMETESLLMSFPQEHDRFVSDTEFSNAGNLVLSTSHDGTAILWSLDWSNLNATMLVRFKADSPIYDGALSSSGEFVILGLDSSIVKLYKSDGAFVKSFFGHTGAVTTVSFSPSNNGQILSAGLDNTARLWDIETGTTLRTFADHNDDVWTASFSPDGHSIITGSYDTTARIWKADPGHDNRVIYGHNDRILSVNFSPEGDMILSSSNDDSIRLWDAQTLEQVTINTSTSLLDPLAAFSAQGRWIAARSGLWSGNSGTDFKLVLWEKVNSEYKQTAVIDQDRFITSLAFSHQFDETESKYLFMGTPGCDAVLLNTSGNWDVAGNYIVYCWNNDIAITQLSSDQNQYVAIAGANDVAIYNITDQSTPVSSCDAQWSYIAFSNDGKYLATGTGAQIVIWNWQNNCQEVVRLTGHSARVIDLAFSPDGKHLLSASMDGTATLWDVNTWQKLRTLTGHEGDVTSVAFSPDGKRIVTGSSDKTIRIWDTDLKDTVNIVCALLQRDFSDQERLKYGIPDNEPTCGQ